MTENRPEDQPASAAPPAGPDRFRLLFNSGNDAVFVHRRQADGRPGRFIEVNDVACRRLGYSREELLRLGPLDIDAPEALPGQPKVTRRLLADKCAVWEGAHLTKDGRRIPVEISCSLLELDGEAVHLSVVRDISERQKMAAALQESQTRQRALYLSMNEGMALHEIVYGAAGQAVDYLILDVNPAFERLTGLRREQAIGSRASQLYGTGQPPFLSTYAEVAATGRPAKFTAVFGPEQKIYGISAFAPEAGRFATVFEDLTERQRADEERQAMIEVLRIASSAADKRSLVSRLIVFLKEWSGCEAVGFRLREGDDFPYYETQGWSEEFVRAESQLCLRDPRGELVREESGEAALACLCGNVLRGRFDPSQTCYTAQGTFWANSAAEMLACAGQLDPRSPVRGRCPREGYESVALVPLRHAAETLGLIQFNHRQPCRFKPANLAILERLADTIAGAVAEKMASQALQDSEARYRRIVETASEGVWGFGVHYETVFANQRMAEMLGYRPEEMLGRPVEDFLFAKDLPAHLVQERERRAGAPGYYERRLRCKDGSCRWMLVSATPMLDEQGRFGGSFAMMTDVTGRKQTEESLRRERDFISTTLETIGSLVVVLDRQGRIVRFNRACEEATGYSRAEAVGRPFWDFLLLPEEMAAVKGGFGKLLAGQSPKQGANHWVTKNGARRWIMWTSTSILDAAGQVEFIIGTGLDLTDHRRLEEQLRQAQKMEAFGQLAGGVAHDFNNVLTIILSHAALLRRESRSEAERRESIDEIAEAAEHAASLTRQLLTFSHRQVRQPQNLDLNDIVTGLLRMLRRAVGDGIVLRTELAPGGAPLRADPSMMEQVIMNLAVNSRDAMPQGGRLTVATADLLVDEAKAQANRAARPGRFVRLSVSDSGCGIPAENLPRLFEPFFTTKEIGQGTGLGLPTVFGIVEQHEGWIEVESQVGRGSTFHIYLPRLAAGAELPVADPVRAEVRGGTETILLVEDEAATRQLLRLVLESHGYRVHEAAAGPAALAAWRKHQAGIDLLLTDLGPSPGVASREFGDRLRREKPGLRLVYLGSAASESPAGTPAGTPAGPTAGDENACFVAKPIELSKLLQAIRNSLDAG